jgi:hypothetical protein
MAVGQKVLYARKSILELVFALVAIPKRYSNTLVNSSLSDVHVQILYPLIFVNLSFGILAFG